MYFNMNTNYITLQKKNTIENNIKHTHTHNYFVEGDKMTTINTVQFVLGGGG